jgi:hypothetical protein
MECQVGVSSEDYRACAIDNIQNNWPKDSCTSLQFNHYYRIDQKVCKGDDTIWAEFQTLFIDQIMYEGDLCGRRCEVNTYQSQKTFMHANKLDMGTKAYIYNT